MADAPVIQIIEKEKFYNQHIVSLPNEEAFSKAPLTAPSTLRVRTKVLSLTANNLTYVKLGFLLGWWDVHPVPASTPAPYNGGDDTYGRTNCWGFAEVLDSTVESVPAGSYLWGYHPIGTLPQDLTIREGELPGHVFVTNAYRQNIMPIYNRYIVHPAAPLGEQIAAKDDAVALDAVVRVMFETSYLINRYVFADSPDLVVHPSPDPSAKWGAEEADLEGATVVVLAPGSKVALAFAYDVRHGRKDTHKPKRVIGAASDASKVFVQGTHLYDEAVSTGGSLVDILSQQQVGKDEKVVILDFGGRAGVGTRWASEIQSSYSRLLVLGIGSDIQGGSKAEVMASMKNGFAGRVQVNADDMRARAIGKVGEKQYFSGLEEEWKGLRDSGIKGLRFNWGEGMNDVSKGWEKLCHGQVAPDEGLVFSL